MIGFLDTGIDYTHPVFRNLDGTTRIAGIWDQTIQDGDPPEGFCMEQSIPKKESMRLYIRKARRN